MQTYVNKAPWRIKLLLSVIFLDFTKVQFIMEKSHVLIKFKEIVNFVKNQFGKTVKALRSDNCGEYKSILFGSY